MEKRQTYADQLRQVRDSLTKDNWWKGAYFLWVDNDRVCMCVHAAAQRIVNPEVRKVFASRIQNTKELVCRAVEVVSPASSQTSAAETEVLKHGSTGYNIKLKDKILHEVWQNRPSDVRKPQEGYGDMNLHWLMGMFGITVAFNDSQSTTLDMIKDRLSDAADWAEKNETFLRNN